MGITWKDLRSVGTKLVLDLQEESLKEKNPKILVKRRKQSTRELHWETEKINNKKRTATEDNCNNHQKVSKKCSKCHKENRCNKYRPRAEKSSNRIDRANEFVKRTKGTLKLTKNENSSDVHMTPQHIHHIEQAFNHAIKTLKHRKKYLKTKMQREQAVRQQQITADQTSSTTWAENLALRNHFSGGNLQKTPKQRSSTTWAECFARHRDIFKHKVKANSNEHYSSKYKCIRISPRHGNDKDLAIRSQERSVGTQMSDRGALGDQKSQTEKGAGTLGYLLATPNPNSTSYHCAPRGHASCHRVHRPENSSCCHQRAEYCFGNCDTLPQFLSHSNQCYDTGFQCHEFTQRSSCLINNGEIYCERSPVKVSPVVKEDNTLFQQKESADERNFSKEMENQSASKKEYQNVCKSVNERAKERDKQEEIKNECEALFQRNVERRKENSQTRNRTHLRPISEGDIKEHRAKNEKRTQEMNEERANKPELSEESEYRRKLKLMQVLDIERATKFQQVFELYAKDFDTRVQKLEETSSTKLVPSPTDTYKVQSKRKTLQKREPINNKSMETSTKQRLDSKAAEYPLETLRLLKTMKILEYKPIKPKSKEIKGNLDLEYQKALGKQQKYQEYVKSYETDNTPRQVNGSSDNSNSQCASAKESQRTDEGLKRYGTFTWIHAEQAIDAQKTYEEFEKDVIQGSAHIQKPSHHETDHSSLKESDANVKIYPNGLASFGSNSTRTTNEAMNSTIERIRNECSAAASIVLENGEVVTYDRITSKYIESEKLPIQQNKESLRNHKSPIIESESIEMRSSPAKPNGVENSTQDKFKVPTADIIRKYLTHTEIENQDHKKTQSEGYHKESFRKNFDDSPVKLFTSQTLDSVKASSPSHKTYIAQGKRDELKTLSCRKESPSSFEPLTIETPISGQETSHSLTENTTISDLEQHKIIKDQRNQVIGSLKANYENKMTKDLNSSYVSPSKRYPPSLFSKDLTENHQRLTNAANTQKLSSDQAAHKNQGLHVNATSHIESGKSKPQICHLPTGDAKEPKSAAINPSSQKVLTLSDRTQTTKDHENALNCHNYHKSQLHPSNLEATTSNRVSWSQKSNFINKEEEFKCVRQFCENQALRDDKKILQLPNRQKSDFPSPDWNSLSQTKECQGFRDDEKTLKAHKYERSLSPSSNPEEATTTGGCLSQQALRQADSTYLPVPDHTKTMESNIDQKSGAFSPYSEGTSTNGVSNLQNSNFVNCEHELNAKALRDDETISYKYQRPLSPSPNPDKSSPKEDLGRQHHSNLVNYDEFKLDLERSHRDFGTRPSSRKTKNYDRNMLAGRPKLDNNPKQESQFIENKTKKLFEGHSTGLNSYEDMLNLGPVGINDSISNRYLSKLHYQFSRAFCKELKQNPKFKNVFSSEELRKAENFNKQPVPEELELQSQNMKDTMNSSGFKEEMVPKPLALKTRSSQKPMNSREGLISANLSLNTLKIPQYLPLTMNPKSNVDLRKTQSLMYEKFHLTTDKNFKKPKDYGTSKNAQQSLEQLEQNICKSKNINKAEIMEKFKSLTSSILQEKDVDTSQYSENEVQKDEQNGTNYTESSVTRQATPAGTFENPTSRQSTTNAYNDDCTKNNKELLQMTEAQIESSRYLLAASENFQTLSDRRIDYNTLHLEKRLQTFSTYPNRIHEALQSLRDLSLNLYNIEPLERHELEEFACEIVKKFSTDRCVERKPSENNPRHTTIEMPTTMTPYKQEKEEVISQNQPNSFGEDHHLETKQIEHAERLQENIQFIPNESSIKESLSNSEFEKNAYLEPSLTNLEGCLYFSPISTTEENNEKTQNLYANGEDNRSNTNINTEQSLRRLESLTGSCPNIPLKGMLNPMKNIRSCANFGITNMPTSELVCCSETNLSPVKDQELKEEHIENEDCVNIYETHTEAYHTENDCIGRGPNNRYFFIPRPGSMSNPPAFSHCPCMFKTYLNILETF